MKAGMGLRARTLDELTEHAAKLAEADSELRWKLVDARKRAGLTQADLAELMGVSQSAVSQFESMGNDPLLSTLREYALALGCMVSHEVTDVRLARGVDGGLSPESLRSRYQAVARKSTVLDLAASVDIGSLAA